MLLLLLELLLDYAAERLIRFLVLGNGLERGLIEHALCFALINDINSCVRWAPRRLQASEGLAHVDGLERLSRAQGVRGQLL